MTSNFQHLTHHCRYPLRLQLDALLGRRGAPSAPYRLRRSDERGLRGTLMVMVRRVLLVNLLVLSRVVEMAWKWFRI